MSASRFVGRVGGLAVALGVGAAVFGAPGTAWADGSTRGSAPGDATTASGDATPAAGSVRGHKTASATSGAVRTRKQGTAPAGLTPSVRVPSVPAASDPDTRAAATDVDSVDAADNPAPVASAVAPVAAVKTSRRAVAADPVVVATEPVAVAEPAQAGAVSNVLAGFDNGLADGAGSGPLVPLDSPISWALLAVARRQSLGTTATKPQASVVTSSQVVSNNGITANPTVSFVDGIFLGSLNAVSSRGLTMTYTAAAGSNGGKMRLNDVPIDPNEPQSYTMLPYANWLDGGTKGIETFNVKIREITSFDKFLTGLPLIGILAGPAIRLLQDLPFVGNLLAPIIGGSLLVPVNVDVATNAPGNTPLAFTYKVTSFDGVKISTNFFPASGLAPGETAPTVFNGPGLGASGATDPYQTNSTTGTVPGLALLRNTTQIDDVAYNVVTWDPRGEFDSGGILQLDNPFFEGRDVSALIDWAAANTPAELTGANDPVAGMVGGSYGGGIQMTTVDPRIDAIVPTIAWNSLNEALYPEGIFKTAWANVLALSLLTTGARVNSQIYPAVLSGNLLGWISRTAQAVLASSGPTTLLRTLTAPALFVQGTVDALFPLQQAVENLQTIYESNPFLTPAEAKMIWFCGGHGVCLDLTPEQLQAQATTIFGYDKAWLNKFVAGAEIPDQVFPTFQWWDQTGNRYTSDLMPFDPAFNQQTPLTGTSAGGRLGINPFGIGGTSGPNKKCDSVGGSAACSWPLNQVFATPTNKSIKVDITPAVGDQVVGAPTVSFTYSGIGTSRSVFAQVVDKVSGRVLGNIATEIPVILDGRTHTVNSAQLADIAYTAGSGASLEVQIVGSTTLYLNSSWGTVNISDVQVALPLRQQD